ncbi:phage tail tape measure protein [Ligilactobacillus agilis]|uniref:phage tail tape measure protein n=1 Tax=Ligilactobacillus agilis TaxID=1601 RepID=UPI00067E8915|nr:phage tail tape measure protein [Ligilactobacillus agilis]
MPASLGHLAATVELDINPFKSSARALNAQIKATTSALKAQETAIKGSGNSINSMRNAYDTMQRQMQNYQAQLKRQVATYEELKGKTASTAEEQEKLATRQANAANQVNKTAANIEILRNKMGALAGQIATQESAWTRLGSTLNNVGDKIKSISSGLTKTGDWMTTRVSAPITAGLVAATKSAVNFNSQIQAMGPLLTNGGTVTAKYKAQLDQLSQASLKWSKQYGVSTTKINEGMSEMIKRGYTAKQTLGAMPNVLNAAKASGEDFNTVMNVSTSTLEQFGLKSNSTAGTLKNTARVTDALTYVANATASGFSDLGEAMTYVGPTAKSTGISLEETAAILGVMANQGIEGSVAGTALRGALTRLLKPSKQNIEGFKKLGINVEDFKKGTLTMPDIIDKIKKHTKGWTQEQRSAAIAMAFGTEAQAGMNALINAGSGELREYTKGAEQAGGTTKKIADQLNNTDAAKFERFKASVQALGIEVGQKLLPALMPIVEKITDWVEAFGKLDSSTQQTIVKLALFGAALGPVLSAVGRVGTGIGTLTKGFGTLATGIGKIAGKRAAATALSEIGSAAAGSTGAISGVGTASTVAAGGLGTLGAALGVAGVAVLGVVAYHELYGKKVAQNDAQIRQWGTTVNQTADGALSKFKGTSTGISSALTDMTVAGKTSTKKLKADFDKQFNQIEKIAKDHMANVKKSVKGLDPEVQAAAIKAAKKEQKSLDASVERLKSYRTQYQAILKQHHGSVASLDENQRVALLNIENKMQNEMLNVLKISGGKRKTILAALNADYKNMSQQQRDNAMATLKDTERETIASYQKQYKALVESHKKGEVSDAVYHAELSALKKSEQAMIDKTADAYYRAAKASGMSNEAIKTNMREAGLSYDQAKKRADDLAKATKNAATIMVAETGNMSKSMRNAADTWNNLIFDPKTGKVRTNAQEEVNKAIQSKDKWNQIQLLEKQGKLSTNAEQMVTKALIESGKWNTLTWKEQKAWIKSNSAETVVKALESNGKWNTLDFQAKEAIVNAKGLPQLAEAIAKHNLWNSLPTKVKELLATDKSASAVLQQAGINLDAYNSKGVQHKNLTGSSADVVNATNRGNQALNGYNGNNPAQKIMTGAAGNVINAANSGRNAVNNYNGTHANHKYFRATDNTSWVAYAARGAIWEFNAIVPQTKVLTTVYKKVVRTVNEVSSWFHWANGTDSHPGGLAMVNDQKGGTFRELITLPGGESFIPNGRNVLLDLPKGTQVTKASQTAKLFNHLPQYADGIGHAINTAEGLSRSVSANTISNNSNVTNVIDNSGVEDNLQAIAGLVGRILTEVAKPKNSNQREALRTVMQSMDNLTVQRSRGRLT